MKQLTLNVDDAVLDSAERKARLSGRSLAGLLGDWLRQFSAAGADPFDRLVQVEEQLREDLRRRGVNFSAADRLSWEELHRGHALR